MGNKIKKKITDTRPGDKDHAKNLKDACKQMCNSRGVKITKGMLKAVEIAAKTGLCKKLAFAKFIEKTCTGKTVDGKPKKKKDEKKCDIKVNGVCRPSGWKGGDDVVIDNKRLEEKYKEKNTPVVQLIKMIIKGENNKYEKELKEKKIIPQVTNDEKDQGIIKKVMKKAIDLYVQFRRVKKANKKNTTVLKKIRKTVDGKPKKKKDEKKCD